MKKYVSSKSMRILPKEKALFLPTILQIFTRISDGKSQKKTLMFNIILTVYCKFFRIYILLQFRIFPFAGTQKTYWLGARVGTLVIGVKSQHGDFLQTVYRINQCFLYNSWL